MLRRFLLLLSLCCLVACSGIPLRSLPRLIQLQSEMLEANPAEFMVAIQADMRMVPPADASPILQIAIRPAEARRVQALLPSACIVEIPRLGHLAHEEQPEAIATIILGRATPDDAFP